ncbi:MAG: phenylalanine--tRNA ligase subunit beta [Saprospiraceae bacterium]|nr:phenylalanine--tRNA ligase subunit beta [Saprospiraceae bacterium]
MKVSLNWLKDYLDIDLTAEQVSEWLTDLGLEVEGLQKVESIKGGLEGVVVGWVKECYKHPGADKLSLTKVDIGAEELLQIVCGAPNVAAGQKVLVATVGTTLYPTGSEEALTIKKGKIRGEVSEGMICAADELGIGSDHSGILVLPDATQVGLPARDVLQLENDYAIEIGLTPNRSDATNHIGVARDLAAALKINAGHSGELRLPDVSAFKIDNHSLPIEVVVENYEACPRYAGVVIGGLTIGESPEWLRRRLKTIGVRPINNVVDATNFILHELGQPLHAFDLEEISGRKVIVKTLPEGTPFASLDEVERQLFAEDLMICDGDSNGMCIGGVFGGIRSGVKDSTTSIFLESAHFHPKSIRRSSMRHNLRTEAAKIFEKGSDPNLPVYALKRAALLIQELAGGFIASEIVDLYPNPVQPAQVEVAYANINGLIGVDIPKTRVKEIFAALSMSVVAETDTSLTVTIPTNKSDVTREADVIEEILRIYGFNNVPEPGRIKLAVSKAPWPDPNQVRNSISDYLAAHGFNETMGLSLSESRYYKEVLASVSEDELVFINNTSSVQLDIMRPTMLMSGLEAILHNQNRQQSNLHLFEFGKTYRIKAEGGYREQQHLSIFLCGKRWSESWLRSDKEQAGYYQLKAYVVNILARLGATGFQETAVQDEIFSYALRCHRGPQELAVFGKLSPRLLKKMDIKGEVFYADLHWDNLLKSASKHRVTSEELNKFPSVRRDLALVIDDSVKFNDIASIAVKVGKKLLRNVNLFDVYESESQLGKGKKSYAVSFVFEDASKTLQDKDIEKIMDQLISAYETQLGALIRR